MTSSRSDHKVDLEAVIVLLQNTMAQDPVLRWQVARCINSGRNEFSMDNRLIYAMNVATEAIKWSEIMHKAETKRINAKSKLKALKALQGSYGRSDPPFGTLQIQIDFLEGQFAMYAEECERLDTIGENRGFKNHDDRLKTLLSAIQRNR